MTAGPDAANAAPSTAPRRRLSRFEWACLGVIALAFAVRLQSLATPDFLWDSAWYLMLARSFAETGTFLIRWSDPPMYSGYWPPLFIAYATPFVKVFGAKYSSLVLASMTATLLLTLAVFLTTRDLFGRTRAFAAAAIVAASPAFQTSDASGMSESLLALMVTLTVWSFLKSHDRPAFLPLAALFGLLAYLGKASLGLPFVAAGIALVGAWRVRSRGLARVLRSPMDVGLALVGVATLATLALTRTEKVGSVGLGVIEPVRRAILEPLWVPVFAFKVLFALAFMLVVTLPFSLRIRDAARAKRTEATGALWIAALFPLVVGAVFTTSFYFTEKRPLVDFDNIRYLTPAFVPFLWVLLPHWDADARPTLPHADGQRLRRRHETWYALAAGSMMLLLLFHPTAGVATLGRLVAFLLLALVPLGFALAARASHVDVQSRRGPKGDVSHRYVAAPAPPGDWGLVLALLGLGALLAWFVSSWYVSIAVGLAVAVATASPRARVIAMALVLLASTAPFLRTPLPVEEAAEQLALLPEGTLVGVSGPIVYVAAVAPDNVRVRSFDPAVPVPPEFGAILVGAGEEAASYPGFVEAAHWDYAFRFSPTLSLRLSFEEKVLGERFELRTERGLTLFVRNATA